MPTNETSSLASPVPATGDNYLVIAADMAAYNGHAITNYHLVMTRAGNDEDALETATSALEDGFLPLAAFSPAELRRLADELTARSLEPARSYNVSADMTDHELFGPDEEES